MKKSLKIVSLILSLCFLLVPTTSSMEVVEERFEILVSTPDTPDSPYISDTTDTPDNTDTPDISDIFDTSDSSII